MTIRKENVFRGVTRRDNEVLRMELKKGMDPDIRNSNGDPIILVASSYQNEEAVRLLLENGANPNIDIVTKDGTTPLIAAAGKNKSESVCKDLIKAGADVNYYNKDGWTPLIAATMEENTKVMKLLIDHGAYIDFMNSQSESALTYSIVWNRMKSLKLLIGEGANINKADEYGCGWTPILYAVQEKSQDMVELLIEKGADINIVDKYGDSLAIHAIRSNKIKIFEKIVNHPSYRETINSAGENTLDVARKIGNSSFVKLLERKC